MPLGFEGLVYIVIGILIIIFNKAWIRFQLYLNERFVKLFSPKKDYQTIDVWLNNKWYRYFYIAIWYFVAAILIFVGLTFLSIK